MLIRGMNSKGSLYCEYDRGEPVLVNIANITSIEIEGGDRHWRIMANNTNEKICLLGDIEHYIHACAILTAIENAYKANEKCINLMGALGQVEIEIKIEE